MSPDPGFTALPNELFFLIGDHISKDRGTLNSLTQVSKRCHNFFSSFLYQNVSDAAMPTLALSEKSRLPLTGAHPASFVYKVSLSPTGTPTPAVFQKQLASALKNIALYNVNGAIQSFAFSSKTVSLPEALGGTISPALRHIEELFLAFPFPSRNNRLSLSLANALCGPSLITLDLDFSTIGASFDYLTLSKLIKRLPDSCPGLQCFSLRIPHSDRPSEAFSKALNDDTLTFPLLKEFHVRLWDYEGNFSECLTAFFRRHSFIEVLRYHVHQDRKTAMPLPLGCRDILPKLRYFEGSVEDGLLLCDSGTNRQLDGLVLLFSQAVYRDMRCRQIRDALAKTPSIRQLYLRESRLGDNLDNIRTAVSSHPNLTHLECLLDSEFSNPSNMNIVYNTILKILPHLVFLKLRVQAWDNWGIHSGMSKENWMTWLGNEHKEATAAAIKDLTDRPLKTLRVEVQDDERFGCRVTPLIDFDA